MTGKVGVAISTHKRPATLARALSFWALHSEPIDELVVIHDRAGDGVAATKNRGIAALMDLGCEHHFYADDDVWPITPNWARPYVKDPEPHLQHIWGKTNPARFIADDGHYTTWTWPRGPLLYVERRVIERVGGMRTEFGRWGGEHREWTCRIHNAGLTTHLYADLSIAKPKNQFWYCTDYTREVPSTVSEAERAGLRERRHALYAKYRGSDEFVEYRT